ncbi:basic proline-rich protein-like [Vidua chalybeata]|uniref:basic proline-rich protein-like n=1 Tax=Vidua chalybeata TaxID=81927 RepID=UPI0023A79473|nr:basic proline-rich protein-like [Vidua chalybeata]
MRRGLEAAGGGDGRYRGRGFRGGYRGQPRCAGRVPGPDQVCGAEPLLPRRPVCESRGRRIGTGIAAGGRSRSGTGAGTEPGAAPPAPAAAGLGGPPGLRARSRCGRGEPGPCRCRARQEDGAFPEQTLDRGWKRAGHGDRPCRPRDPAGSAAPSAPPPAPRGAAWRTRSRPAAPGDAEPSAAPEATAHPTPAA